MSHANCYLGGEVPGNAQVPGVNTFCPTCGRCPQCGTPRWGGGNPFQIAPQPWLTPQPVEPQYPTITCHTPPATTG